MNNNGFPHPPPPPPDRPLPIWPRVDSVYNKIVRRLRAARTMFEDRIKLVLRQQEQDQWTRLPKPYLLVVPTQVRRPIELNKDAMNFVDPRSVTLIAMFEGRGSEQDYMAADDIDSAELQLIYVLANWRPGLDYQPTQYEGWRLQATQAPDVRVHYFFVFHQFFAVADADEFDGEDVCSEDMLITKVSVHISDPCCNLPCELIPPLGPDFLVSGGGCPCDPPPDPCAPPPCPPPV